MRDSMWSILWTEADSARVTLGGKLRLGWMSVVALMVCRVASCKANMDCMHRMLSWSSCVTLPQARNLFRRENPGKSFMWQTHLSLHSRNDSVCKKFVHHCQYGSSRQKLAKFLHNTPAFSQLELGVRPCVTAKLPLLSPWFWNLILLNLAILHPLLATLLPPRLAEFAASASRLLRMCWSSRGLRRLLLAPFNASSEKWKNVHRRYIFCAGSQSNSFTWCVRAF